MMGHPPEGWGIAENGFASSRCSSEAVTWFLLWRDKRVFELFKEQKNWRLLKGIRPTDILPLKVLCHSKVQNVRTAQAVYRCTNVLNNLGGNEMQRRAKIVKSHDWTRCRTEQHKELAEENSIKSSLQNRKA